METACCLERVSLSPRFGTIIRRGQVCKARNSVASCLYCSKGYSALPSTSLSSPSSKFFYPSSSSQPCSLRSVTKHFLCSFDEGSPNHLSRNLVVALGSSSYSTATPERVYASFVHSSDITKSPLVGCEYMTSGARIRICNFSSLLNGTIYSNREQRNAVDFDRRSASTPCRCSIMIMTILPFSVPLEYERQSYRKTFPAHGFGVGNRLATEHSPQLSCVFWLRRAGNNRARGGLFQLCKAIGQSGTGQPAPEEENPEPSLEQGPPDSQMVSPGDTDPPEVDWRAFRARLVVTEHTTTSDETGTCTNAEQRGSMPANFQGTRWAHPILAPEAGCLLIATDKIDGQQSFERSVVLLLSPGSSNPREGPYGLILNRPLSCRIKDIRPKDRTLVNFFGNCQVHHGGPLDEDTFLLLHGTSGVKGYREVIPGVYCGAARGLAEILKGNHVLDYRFFFGYSGWGVEQLKKEIDAGLWCVAACSTELITGHSAAGLWEEILLLMGGKYGELSKRPRRRHF